MPADQMLYFVKADFGRLGMVFLETDPDRNSRVQVIADIASGEIRNPNTVLECNPVEGTCRDVTEDVARDVYDALSGGDEACPDRLRNWFDLVLGVSSADRLDIATGNFSVGRTADRIRAAAQPGFVPPFEVTEALIASHMQERT